MAQVLHGKLANIKRKWLITAGEKNGFSRSWMAG